MIAFYQDYSAGFFDGAQVADSFLVPGTYPVAINGHPYILNTDRDAVEEFGDNFSEEALPLLRPQADQAARPGEQSLSPSQFWRRSMDSWHSGAGQSVLDRDSSIQTRFNTSKGVNPWTKYQLSLLPSTSRVRTSANSGLLTVGCDDSVYIADGTVIARTADLSAFTNVTGTPATGANSFATNGETVWSGHGANGVYATTGTTATSYATGTASFVGYSKGRLLVASGSTLYNVTAPGAITAGTNLGAPAGGWVWTDVTEADAVPFIYASGYTGNRSRVYRITIQPDGTALTAPTVAGVLPTGERVWSMLGYLSFLILGTDKGVRFATVSSTGDLTLGSLIPTPQPVYALDAADRFVWFGWSRYETGSSGLGRLDLQTINDGLAPAYASDLMATGTSGSVNSTALAGIGRRLFAVDGSGFWAEQGVPVSTGYVTSGQITYGLSDPKVPIAVDVKHEPLVAGTSVSVTMATDRDVPQLVGTSDIEDSVSPANPLFTGARRAEEFEVTVTLNSSGGVGPVLNRWTLRSYPAPSGASIVTLPVFLKPAVTTFGDSTYPLNPLAEYLFLRDLHFSREIATVQVGSMTFQGVIDSFKWLPERHIPSREWWGGTMILFVRRIDN